jgi:hypothetical protein
MTFTTEGFFSAEIDQFRTHVRSTEPSKLWFEYALEFVGIGLKMLGPLETSLSDERLLYLNAAFVRVHQTFQSVLLLAERGLINDARALLRGGVETAIAINALARDPGFVGQIKDAHFRSRRTLARKIKQHFASSYMPEQLARFDAEIAEADAWEGAKGTPGGRKIELTDIKWEQGAALYSHELYQLLYRSFSADGAHFTLDALERFLVVDAGRITGLNVGPDGNGLIDVLSGAVLMFLWSAGPFAEMNALTGDAATIQARVQEFEKLPNAFPKLP